MDDRLALRPSGGMVPHDGYGASSASGAGSELEENEDEKVYYGFGVFMGLPLADLKAMKEDFLQNQTHTLTNGEGGNTNGNNSTVMTVGRDNNGNGRVAPPHVGEYSYEGGRQGTTQGQLHRSYANSSSSANDSMINHRGEYSQQREESENGSGHHSDDSDGSHSAPKSHSLNFILH